MVRHNNAIQKNHFKYHWNPTGSQRGHVKTWLHQPMQKKARRLRRQAKALQMFPRPAGGSLRPSVRANTQRYNMKTRIGRGFTKEELYAAGLDAGNARTIGIAIDHRRRNKSQEGLEANVQRLKQYLAKLVLFPRKSSKAPKKSKAKKAASPKKTASPKKAASKKTTASKFIKFAPHIATKDEINKATQDKSHKLKDIIAPATGAKHEAPRALTADEKKRHIHQFIRKNWRDAKLVGVRQERAKRKAKEAEEAKDGK